MILHEHNNKFLISLLSIAAKRPPVEETANFLQTLLENHGANYLEKLFGSKARDALAPLGGAHKVAVALSGQLYCFGHQHLLIIEKFSY